MSAPLQDDRYATGQVASPWGPWSLIASPRGIVRVAFATEPANAAETGEDEAWRILTGTREQILAYLRGERRQFDVPLDLGDATEFQRRVWEACEAIPYGATTTYGKLADSIGAPKGARAVGQALGSNPVPILIPCHRIIASDGSLGGYGGGLALKRALLALERTWAAH
ncbi:MAG: methylated-DNA--[protein]-cysteine S-methyltransferase [Anaerolineae bacterium]